MHSQIRMLKAIKFGDFSISIQASANTYCQPREVMAFFSDYESMEVATFYKDQWCVLTNFTKYYDIFEDISEMANTVAGYVPVEIIQEMVDELKSGQVSFQLCGQERS